MCPLASDGIMKGVCFAAVHLRYWAIAIHLMAFARYGPSYVSHNFNGVISLNEKADSTSVGEILCLKTHRCG